MSSAAPAAHEELDWLQVAAALERDSGAANPVAFVWFEVNKAELAVAVRTGVIRGLRWIQVKRGDGRYFVEAVKIKGAEALFKHYATDTDKRSKDAGGG